jgi:metallo-beta-lactamase class B
MKRQLGTLLCNLLLLAGASALPAAAQTNSAEAHVALARAAAYRPAHDVTYVFDSVCKQPGAKELAAGSVITPLNQRRVPPRSEWYAEPGKVFDNLYFIGSAQDSVWAVKTSEGLILVDSGQDYSAPELITGGLRKLGLDPAQIKYVVLSHAHGDRYFGSRYVQDTYHPRVLMTEADWDVVAKTQEQAEAKPKKDMVVTDGMKVTLGDTTLTLYVTPGHTPGTISTLIPLKDGRENHLGAIFGGLAWDYGRYGVQYFADNATAIKTWSASAKRWMDITRKAGADVYLSIHPHHDKTLDRINAIRFRGPRDPHPFVDASAIQNHLTVINECLQAQLAWRSETGTN